MIPMERTISAPYPRLSFARARQFVKTSGRNQVAGRISVLPIHHDNIHFVIPSEAGFTVRLYWTQPRVRCSRVEGCVSHSSQRTA
jgi:hypothetical protein